MYKICQYGVPNSRFLVPDLANPEKKQKLGNSYVTYQINALGKLIGMDQFKLGISGFQIWKIWRILKEGKRHDTYYYSISSLYGKFHVNSSLCHS